MASKVDNLLIAFEQVLAEPWAQTLSGQERVWFLIYDPADQRKIDLRLGDFEAAARNAGKNWVPVSLKECFPYWMASHEYREEYFSDPEALADQLEVEFKPFVIDYIQDEIQKAKADDNTIIVIKDVTAIFGFARLSNIISTASDYAKGRMLVLFPGEFSKNQYRLLDARDGWSYLARPITA
ncbi:hypothetical protein AAE02nite_10220 [Adhaeribacter aerolatus]|uniref:DUF1788 domain-containing protein n=1 Tax=Adhaeribacter aerolatus TaxID=670289 RepID=A0A512AUG6_9BACT|nr:BREX protein BrxB domain-containing protein [Adhaeribacter aerolatus]GEO03358.1 hypothetical protein AAE02nite_10220 [Adhaeribacter aerolatus]